LSERKPAVALSTAAALASPAERVPEPEACQTRTPPPPPPPPYTECASDMPTASSGTGRPPPPRRAAAAAAAAAVIDVGLAHTEDLPAVRDSVKRLAVQAQSLQRRARGSASGTASFEGSLRGSDCAGERVPVPTHGASGGAGAAVGADGLRRMLMAEYELLRAADLAFGWSEVRRAACRMQHVQHATCSIQHPIRSLRL
jgi:hypothetical protein